MIEHTGPQPLSQEAVVALLAKLDSDAARKMILGIAGRDRTFVGCACAPAGAELVAN
jgi:hypothetical protein